jgi:CheY-like chemotaxis protein
MSVILIVDDCENDRLLVRRALNKSVEPFRICEVEDTTAAMCYLKGQKDFSDRGLHPFPDLIVCDLHFPKESGFSLIEKINAPPALKGIGVALMSGHFSPEMRCLAMEKGACACIDKGDLVCNPGPFLSAVEECLRQVLADCETGTPTRT